MRLALRTAGLLAALLLPSLAGHPAAGVAHAEDAPAPVFDGLFVELLPVGDLPGDGATPVTLHLLALDAFGQPLQGVELKTKISGGTLSEPHLVRDGLIRFTYTAPQVDQTGSVTLEFKGKTATKDKFKRSVTLQVQPPVSQQVQVGVSPDRLVLQDGATATLNIAFVGGSSQYREGARLQLRANTGTIENVTPLGDGAYTALYRAPESDVPQVAVITAVDGRDPTRTYGHVTLPLTAPKELVVQSEREANVLVRVGDREFGPVPADRRGRATVPVVVPPGVREGTLITLKDNARSEAAIDLEVPPTPRIELLGHYPDLPGDARVDLPVRVAVSRPDGTPDPSAQLLLEAEGATVSGLTHEGAGVYRAELDPQPSGGVVETALVARLAGEDEAEVRLPLRLVPVRPTALEVTPTPRVLTQDDTHFSLELQVRDAGGGGLAGRTIDFQGAGARLEGPVEDRGDGTYKATFSRMGKGPAEVLTTVKAPASTNPVRQVLALPTVDRLQPDGLSSTVLTLLAVDEFGYPVADVDLRLNLLRGDGKLPTKAKTDASGIAQVQYTAGRETGLVKILVEAGDRATQLGLLQMPADLAPGLHVPFNGTPMEAALEASWRPIVQGVRLERE